MSFASLSSVTRWLLVVAGCVVLETAQPAKAAADAASDAASTAESAPAAPAEVPPAGESAPAEPTAAPKREAEERRADTLLIPGGMPRAGVGAPSASPSASWVVVLLFCAAGAAWWWWRRRGDSPLGRGQRTRLIQIVESRPLGNRQYLVVATVEDRRFLLGVTPGSIQMLSPLATKEEAVHEPAA